MHRYHFDLVDTNSVTDVTGAVLVDDNQAKNVAMELVRDAWEGRPDLVGHGYEIVVRRSSGEEISRLPLDCKPQKHDGV